MTLYSPGRGHGRTLHLRRVRALQTLEKQGLLTFHHYRRGTYVLTTAAGEKRSFTSAETAAYVLGLADLYCLVRPHVDEAAGDSALTVLDDRYLDVLSACLNDVLPTGEPS